MEAETIQLTPVSTSSQLPDFATTLKQHQQTLRRNVALDILQVNVGKLCNLACHHCHVDAGPKRTEIMSWATMQHLLRLLDATEPSPHTVDITGGAPELNPYFRDFVSACRERGIHVIDRCNLTVLFEDNQQDTAQFLAQNNVEIVASLPCYSLENVDKQRGIGTFDKSIRALQQLNALGYGQPDSGLVLNLVYNPLGAHLPPAQQQLEADYKQQLQQNFDIVFNHLLTITNMPIKRFAHQLDNDNALESYMQLLLDNFNPGAAENIMCRNLVSIGWDGAIYDCDFNQMLEIPLNDNKRNISELSSLQQLCETPIATDLHCYGCTAGSGSSCSGALA